MHAYIYVNRYVYVKAYKSTCTRMYACICIYIYMYMYMYAQTFQCLCCM